MYHVSFLVLGLRIVLHATEQFSHSARAWVA